MAVLHDPHRAEHRTMPWSVSLMSSYSNLVLRMYLQVEIATPLPDRPDHGRLQFSVECSACAGPALQVC